MMELLFAGTCCGNFPMQKSSLEGAYRVRDAGISFALLAAGSCATSVVGPSPSELMSSHGLRERPYARLQTTLPLPPPCRPCNVDSLFRSPSLVAFAWR